MIAAAATTLQLTYGYAGDDPASSHAHIGLLPAFAVFASVGAINTSHRPQHRIGWIYVISAVGAGVGGLASALIDVDRAVAGSLPRHPGRVVGQRLLLHRRKVPMATAVSILRYRPYDIDRIVGRTVSCVLITALLLGAYAGLVILFEQVTRPVTGGSDIAIATSTLIVAAAFRPVRRRVQSATDRRFNRRRYDAAQTIEAFAAHPREETDIERPTGELRNVVRQTMEPTGVSVRLPGG